jgi:hypothetical protein
VERKIRSSHRQSNPKMLIDTPFIEDEEHASPDGHWWGLRRMSPGAGRGISPLSDVYVRTAGTKRRRRAAGVATGRP